MRLFIALKTTLYEDELYEVVKEVRNKIDDDVKWVTKDNLHVTTKFLGEVQKDFIPVISEILEHVSKILSPFYFKISGISGFPKKEDARVLFFSIIDNSHSIEKIMRLLDEAFSPYHFKAEESYVPHITFGRVRYNLVDLTKVEIAPFEFEVKSLGLTLFESVLRNEGPLYRELMTFDFKDKSV